MKNFPYEIKNLRIANISLTTEAGNTAMPASAPMIRIRPSNSPRKLIDQDNTPSEAAKLMAVSRAALHRASRREAA